MTSQRPLAAALALYAVFMALHVALAWEGGRIITSLWPAVGPWLGSVTWAAYSAFVLLVAIIYGLSRTGITRLPGPGWVRLCAAPVIAGMPFLLFGYNLEPGLVTPLLVVGVPLVALNEELFFRGVILDMLRPLGWRSAVLWSAFLFGGSHLANLVAGAYPPFTAMQVAATTAGAITLAAIRIRTGSLWPVLLVHLVLDLVAVSTLTGPATASPILLPALFLWLGANLALWWYGWRLLAGRSADELDALADGLDASHVGQARHATQTG